MANVGDRSDRDILLDHDREIGENRHDLNNLRQIIDIKLEKITEDINDMRNALKWAGGLIVSLMLSFMAWALLQQYNANEAAKNDLQDQIRRIEQQDRQQVIDQDEIMGRSTSRAAEPATTSNSAR